MLENKNAQDFRVRCVNTLCDPGVTYAICIADELLTTFFLGTNAGGAKAVADAKSKAEIAAVNFMVNSKYCYSQRCFGQENGGGCFLRIEERICRTEISGGRLCGYKGMMVDEDRPPTRTSRSRVSSTQLEGWNACQNHEFLRRRTKDKTRKAIVQVLGIVLIIRTHRLKEFGSMFYRTTTW